MTAQTDRPLRIAILSFAHTHALSYAQALQARADVELLSADPDGAAAPDDALRGRALADTLGVAYVDTYDEAFAWQPDAVIVAAENTRHRDLVLRAAAAGVHVLCEKPLATDRADAELMERACAEAGVQLMVAFPVRFAPTFRDAAALLRSGRLGRILAVSGENNGKLPTDRAWFTDPAFSGGGALVDHVVHCADLLDELLGEPVASVRAVSNTILHPASAVETGGIVSLSYPSGVIATIDCSWSEPTTSPAWGGVTFQIMAELGTLTIRPFGSGVTGHDASGETWRPIGPDLDEVMIDTFLRAVRSGDPAQPDGAVGVRTVSIVDAARQSAREGGRVIAV